MGASPNWQPLQQTANVAYGLLADKPFRTKIQLCPLWSNSGQTRVRLEWTSVFGSERLTGALLDRLTHHVHILEMNGDSYRLNQSKRRSRRASSDRRRITPPKPDDLRKGPQFGGLLASITDVFLLRKTDASFKWR